MWYIREGDEIEKVVEDLNEYLADNGMEGVVATDTTSLPSRYIPLTQCYTFIRVARMLDINQYYF